VTVCLAIQEVLLRDRGCTTRLRLTATELAMKKGEAADWTQVRPLVQSPSQRQHHESYSRPAPPMVVAVAHCPIEISHLLSLKDSSLLSSPQVSTGGWSDGDKTRWDSDAQSAVSAHFATSPGWNGGRWWVDGSGSYDEVRGVHLEQPGGDRCEGCTWYRLIQGPRGAR
jgi:hypothetical protein